MLTKEHIDYRKDDQEIWESELESWVPQRVYDCHMHMLDNSLIAEGTKYRDLYPDTDFETAQAWHNLVLPGRETHFLMLGRPATGTDVYGHNTFMHREMQSDPLSRRNRLTMPSDTPEEIERDVKERGFIGLKVYRFYSVTGDMKDCRIHEFLPHEQMEVASELGLWVTMHLSRAGGGDEENLRDLEEYTTKRYPGIRWILAHCARSFVYWQMERGIGRLKADAEHLVRHLRRDRRAPVHHAVPRGGPPAHLLRHRRHRVGLVPRLVHGVRQDAPDGRDRQGAVPPLRPLGLPAHHLPVRAAPRDEAGGGDCRTHTRSDRGYLLAERRAGAGDRLA